MAKKGKPASNGGDAGTAELTNTREVDALTAEQLAAAMRSDSAPPLSYRSLDELAPQTSYPSRRSVLSRERLEAMMV